MDANWWFRKVLLGIPLRFLFPVTVIGWENLPKSGSFIIAAGSHTTEIESALIAANLHPLRIRFFAKAEYWKNPVVGWFMTATGQVPVDRSARDIGTAVVEVGVKLLRTGRRIALLFFPESTRSYDGKVHRGGVSAARISIRTDTPVIPVGLIGMEGIQPQGATLRQLRLFRRAVINIGKPIYPSEWTSDASTKGLMAKQIESIAAKAMTDKIMRAIANLCVKDYSPDRLAIPGK